MHQRTIIGFRVSFQKYSTARKNKCPTTQTRQFTYLVHVIDPPKRKRYRAASCLLSIACPESRTRWTSMNALAGRTMYAFTLK
eukprot:CCRYP_014411-RA/>CCRYP_014411-RA protein AED:0.22 eAED:0.22 QI:1105/1/1/1/0/0/2/452/82